MTHGTIYTRRDLGVRNEATGITPSVSTTPILEYLVFMEKYVCLL